MLVHELLVLPASHGDDPADVPHGRRLLEEAVDLTVEHLGNRVPSVPFHARLDRLQLQIRQAVFHALAHPLHEGTLVLGLHGILCSGHQPGAIQLCLELGLFLVEPLQIRVDLRKLRLELCAVVPRLLQPFEPLVVRLLVLLERTGQLVQDLLQFRIHSLIPPSSD